MTRVVPLRARSVGEVETFDAFYQREYRSIVGLAYVLSGSAAEAEDLAQDALSEAHKRWEQVCLYENPQAWVRRVLVNRSSSRFRRLASEAKAKARLRSEPRPPIELTPRSTEVWAAVRALPRRQAQAIALQYWDDYSVAQIAETLECGTETVKTHLSRARAALALSLDDPSTFGSGEKNDR